MLLDVDGYWAPLAALVDHVIAEGFAGEALAGYFSRHDGVEALEAALRNALSSRSAASE